MIYLLVGMIDNNFLSVRGLGKRVELMSDQLVVFTTKDLPIKSFVGGVIGTGDLKLSVIQLSRAQRPRRMNLFCLDIDCG